MTLALTWAGGLTIVFDREAEGEWGVVAGDD